MDKVRIGLVGFGNIGTAHASVLPGMQNAVLAAICDTAPDRIEAAHKLYPNVPTFSDYDAMLDSKLIDAVLIATPHPSHPDQTIAAFNKGLHVLSEKPVAVGVKDARRMNEAAAKHPELKFAADFQLRTLPLYQKVRELIATGELGTISRVTWIITAWFRTWAYYASGGWRATWKGEGGGVLLNQCPHNLDLLPWITGMMPERVTAVVGLAKTHPIEVEDEVSAILEYPNGAVGHFITTTGEAPGTDRLEIAGDRGKIVVESGKGGGGNTIRFTRTVKPVKELLEKSAASFPKVDRWDIDIPFPTNVPTGHKIIIQNFAEAIQKGTPLIAPGVEGVKGLEIGNAMLLSGITNKPVTLPLDGDNYEQLIKDLDKKYGGKKTLKERKIVKAIEIAGV